MSSNPSHPDEHGLLRTYVLPALWVFLIPGLAVAFFYHAQASFDAQSREAALRFVQQDRSLTDEQRAAAVTHFQTHPFSELILDEQFAKQVDKDLRRNFASFRWMIALGWGSIILGLVAFVLTGFCVWLSTHSQWVQYWSLLIGWLLLCIYGAVQTLAIGVLLVAMSFWVTALWFNFYSEKIILMVAIVAIGSALAVLKAIFTIPKLESTLEGRVISRNDKLPVWDRLHAICQRVGAECPDQIVAGIDDNFFVTEFPITIQGKVFRGKTLYVSLSLLKQLDANEADAVIAHEMAHFSGNDTLYTMRTAPLLSRFDMYLNGLHQGISIPVYYFMLCFRALFELSLSKLRREREFRADRIASEVISPRDVASSLLRVVAYSRFRQHVEQELFQLESVLQTADVSHRIEQGFPEFSLAFAADPNIGGMATSHPFDSHPPLAQRLAAIGVNLTESFAKGVLGVRGDGRWSGVLPEAASWESEQWQAYEDRFRDAHEQSLPFRFLPSNEQEQAIVEKAFPLVRLEGWDGALVIDYEKVVHASWPDPILFQEIVNCEVEQQGKLLIHFNRGSNRTRFITLNRFQTPEPPLEVFQRYYGRYLSAVEFAKQTSRA